MRTDKIGMSKNVIDIRYKINTDMRPFKQMSLVQNSPYIEYQNTYNTELSIDFIFPILVWICIKLCTRIL